jgi:hypothetical protein
MANRISLRSAATVVFTVRLRLIEHTLNLMLTALVNFFGG